MLGCVRISTGDQVALAGVLGNRLPSCIAVLGLHEGKLIQFHVVSA